MISPLTLIQAIALGHVHDVILYYMISALDDCHDNHTRAKILSYHNYRTGARMVRTEYKHNIINYRLLYIPLLYH